MTRFAFHIIPAFMQWMLKVRHQSFGLCTCVTSKQSAQVSSDACANSTQKGTTDLQQSGGEIYDRCVLPPLCTCCVQFAEACLRNCLLSGLWGDWLHLWWSKLQSVFSLSVKGSDELQLNIPVINHQVTRSKCGDEWEKKANWDLCMLSKKSLSNL